MRLRSRLCAVLAQALSFALVGSPALADETIVLKDGRTIEVTRMGRRGGFVVFQTAAGEVFRVPEADVVSPPLDRIPLLEQAALPSPSPAAPQVIVLKDGRRIEVTRMGRRAGFVVFQTTAGEVRRVPEGDVQSPPVASIPDLQEPTAPPPSPPPAPVPTPAVPAAPMPPSLMAPSPLPALAPAAAYPLPELEPLGFAGGTTVETHDPPSAEFVPMADRWRLGWPRYQRYQTTLPTPWVEGSPFDPYNQNLLKADYPIRGNELFLSLALQSNSNLNPRKRPSGDLRREVFYNQNLAFGLELFKGDTVFRPKDWAVRATAVLNANFLAQDPESFRFDLKKGDGQLSLEEAFIERRLAAFRPSFDFASVRAGMQNFTSDFRGFVFSDNQLGVRLFGNSGANRVQYNLAWFPMRQREEASQLHRFDSRDQHVFIANAFVQDFLAGGYTLLLNLHHNRDDGHPGRPGIRLDRGRQRVTYVGVHGDGHWGRWNVSHAAYQAFGSDDSNPLIIRSVDVNAQMAALELSRDSDWRRWRLSLFYASGDKEPLDDRGRGFDAIMDNPNFAGGPFMFWTQQKLAALDPGGVVLSDKFSLLPSMRSKFNQRSNFVNPGLLLAGAGLDMRLSPKLKVVTNGSYLRFATAAPLREIASDPTIGETIGIDLSLGVKYRPLLNENLFLVGGASALLPRGGFARALPQDETLFSTFLALQLAY